jgi:hypothetical protein
MPDTIPDLWPEDVTAPTVLTPLAILRFQAGQLRQRTKGLLEADVQTQNLLEGRVQHSFDLIAPALNRYRYRLFTVEHDLEMVYPVTVSAEGVGFPVNQLFVGETPAASAFTQDQFLELVARILKADHVRSAIQSLLARSNEANSGARPS